MEDRPRCCFHLNVDKTEVFWSKEDPRSRLACVFPPNIARPLHGVKLLGGPASVDFNFSNELVMKRMAKTIVLMDAVAKINYPQCELLLLHACTGDVSNYAFLASRLQSASLQTKLVLHLGIVASGPSFDNALCAFNTKMETGLLSNASEIAALKLMKKLADIYFIRGGSDFWAGTDYERLLEVWYVIGVATLRSLVRAGDQTRGDARSGNGDLPPYLLGLGVLASIMQTKLLRHSGIVASGPAFNDALCAFNMKMEIDLLSNASKIAAPKLMKKLADIYFTRATQTAKSTFSLSSRQMALWCPLFSVLNSCSACSNVFLGDICGDHDVSCAGIIGIKHRHNVVRDTMVDICFRSGISAEKETGMVDFVPGRAVIDATHRKRVKYEAKCANIGYGFLPFSFSSLGELEKDAVNLLKRI
ncbi:hypothetical protein Tco_1284953 [Tanacetum coccineum]